MIAAVSVIDAFFTVLFQPYNGDSLQKYSAVVIGSRTGIMPDQGCASLPLREVPGGAEKGLLLQWGRLRAANQFTVPFKHACMMVFIIDSYDPDDFREISPNGFAYTGLKGREKVIYYAIGR